MFVIKLKNNRIKMLKMETHKKEEKCTKIISTAREWINNPSHC